MDAAALLLAVSIPAFAGTGTAPQGSAPAPGHDRGSVALPLELSAAARRFPCQARPGGVGWSWRLVSGRRCWYPGRRARSKPGLYWPAPEPQPPLPPALPRPDVALAFASAPDLDSLLAAIWPDLAAPPLAAAEVYDAIPPGVITAPPPEPLDEPLPVWRVKTVSYRAPPPPTPPPRPSPAWLTLILWGIGLGSGVLAIAAARPPPRKRGATVTHRRQDATPPFACKRESGRIMAELICPHCDNMGERFGFIEFVDPIEQHWRPKVDRNFRIIGGRMWSPERYCCIECKHCFELWLCEFGRPDTYYARALDHR